jgi:ATP-binding protein involved in chromosome partitioning
MDPRLAVIDRRLEGIERILAVTGGKGGIGKSLVATTLAFGLAQDGRRAGLLDLDLTGPSDHVILGVKSRFPDEKFGVEPLDAGGVRFMSTTCFAGDAPVPLRGADVTNALLEILAITRWGSLDVLVIDMPPGLGDALLDAIRLLRRAEHLAVATDSRVVLETVRKNLSLLRRLDVPVVGVVENMARGPGGGVRHAAEAFAAPYLGCVPWDYEVEAALGDPQRLVSTRAGAAIRAVGLKLLGAA